MNNVINNGWVISLASILVTFAITPFLQRGSDWMRSRHGTLTGTYLGITQTYGYRRDKLQAEVVECRHIGQRIKGTITTQALLSLDREGGHIRASSTPDDAKYNFVGHVRDNRQALISYWDASKASQHGGTMTMMLDISGWAFQGLWCGTSQDGDMISSPSVWIRDTDDKIKEAIDNGHLSELFLSGFVTEMLDSIENPWRKSHAGSTADEITKDEDDHASSTVL